jgi:hypothetical protein
VVVGLVDSGCFDCAKHRRDFLITPASWLEIMKLISEMLRQVGIMRQMSTHANGIFPHLVFFLGVGEEEPGGFARNEKFPPSAAAGSDGITGTLRPVTLPHHRTRGFPQPAVEPGGGHLRASAMLQGMMNPGCSRTLQRRTDRRIENRKTVFGAENDVNEQK